MGSIEEGFFRVLGLKGTKDILTFLDEHGPAQYRDFHVSISVSTLNKRLRELLMFDLINHCLTREGGRKEWYEITEKGREVAKHLKRLTEIIQSGNE